MLWQEIISMILSCSNKFTPFDHSCFNKLFRLEKSYNVILFNFIPGQFWYFRQKEKNLQCYLLVLEVFPPSYRGNLPYW